MQSSQKQFPNTNVWESDQTYELQVEIVDEFDVAWTTNLGLAEPGSTVDAPQMMHKGTAGLERYPSLRATDSEPAGLYRGQMEDWSSLHFCKHECRK